MRRCRLAACQARVALVQYFSSHPHSDALLFPNLPHPLLPLLPHDDRGSVVGVGLGESCGQDGRALGADRRADGHEESLRVLVVAQVFCRFFPLSIPESGSRADHVLAQSPHHAVGSRAEADDVGRAEDEADD